MLSQNTIFLKILNLNFFIQIAYTENHFMNTCNSVYYYFFLLIFLSCLFHADSNTKTSSKFCKNSCELLSERDVPKYGYIHFYPKKVQKADFSDLIIYKFLTTPGVYTAQIPPI